MTVCKTGVDKTVVDETGVDELGINPIIAIYRKVLIIRPWAGHLSAC